MLLLLLLKIKKNVTLLSQMRNNYSQRVWHGVFECIMIIMESAGSLEVSMCSNIRVIDDLTRSDIFVRPLNM